MSNKNAYYLITLILLFSFIAISVSYADKSGIENLRQTGKAFASVAKKVSPSVVFIKVESIKKNVPVSPYTTPFGDELFKRFFGDSFPDLPDQQTIPSEQRVIGQGSGFVFSNKESLFSKKIYILTNNHVVEGADKIHITFQDGSEYDAKLVGTDPKSDIAVLEIKGNSHPSLSFGNSSSLEVGEWVIALGNPFGLSHTLTVGVVSAKGRTELGINDYEDFIQTDAAINPGNSGGPLLNLDGEVVGMNTAIFSRSGGYMGVGFAIPINLVSNIADQLIKDGKVTRGYLGIIIQAMTPELSKSFGLDVNKGILISQVSEGSPANKAGLKIGDLIIRYQGKDVYEVGDFRNQVALTAPGKKAIITVIREGKPIEITVTIGKFDQASVISKSAIQTSDELGLEVQTITPDLAKQFSVKPGIGVIVTAVKSGSLSAIAGIREGVVIAQVDRKNVNTAEQFKKYIEQSKKNKQVLFLIRDKDMSRYIVLQWP